MNDFKFKLKKIYFSLENKKIIFSILFLFNIVMGFYKYDITNLTFFEFVIYNITNNFYVLMLFFVLLIILFSSVSASKKNLNFILKFNNKENFIGNVIESFVFEMCIVFLINFLMIIIFSLLLFRGDYAINNIPYYDVSFFAYFLFFYIRMILILIIYGIIIILLEKNFGKILSLCGSILFMINLLLPMKKTSVLSIMDMKWYGSAYLNLVQYPTFMTELFCSLLYIFVLMILVGSLIYIYIKYSKDIK